jgi:hypothetical protein
MKDVYAKIREDLERLEERIDPEDATGQELAFQGYELAYQARILETEPAKIAQCYMAARVACKMLRDHLAAQKGAA